MTKPSWKNKPLASALPRAWALEARLMFDAAAVVEATERVAAAEAAQDAAGHPEAAAPAAPPAAPPLFVLEAPALPPDAGQKLQQAIESASTQVQAFLQQPDAAARLAELFHGGEASRSEAWSSALADLQAGAAQGWGLELRLLSSGQLNGALGAFAADGPQGRPVVLLNADWLAGSASVDALTRVLVEETGHAIDARLNAGADTAGDEGEAFASQVLRFDLSAGALERIGQENDHASVLIDGRAYAVEEASVTFTQVYRITPTSLSEEANGFRTDASALAGSNFRFTSGNPSDPYFSGNNVTGTLSYVDGSGTLRSISGVVSRLVKTGSTVNGLYFYAPGADGAIGTGDDSAYVLRVNDSFNFTGNTNYGTSSDPVDSAMNRFIAPNSAPVAVNDSALASEDGSVSGNVLSNDSDLNADTLRVTSFKVGTTTYTVASGGSATAVLAGVGTLTLNSDGSFVFTAAADYSGAVPVVSYTASDGTATATGTLSVGITPVNDAPAGADRSITLAEGGSYTFVAGDFGFSDPRDNPSHALQSVRITSLPSAGTLTLNGNAVTAGQEIAAADLGRLVFTPVGGASGAAYASFTFQVRDNGGTAGGGVDLDATPNTVVFNVTAVNQAPSAGGDTATAVEAGGVANGTPGTDPSGNVLANDSDPDAGDALVVGAVTGAAGGSVAPAPSSSAASNPAVVSGLYGTLRMGADGSYVYQVNNTLAAVQALRNSSNTLVDTFTYVAKDASGASSTSTLTVTVRGANDAPVAANDRNVAKEAGPTPAVYPGSDATGNVLANDNDVDTGDSKTVLQLIASATAAATGSSSGTQITVGSVGTPGNTSGVDVGDVLHVTANGTVLYDKNPASLANRVTVTAISGTTITLNRSVSIPAGASIQFWAPNPGGQINGSNYYTTTGQSSTSVPASSTLSLSNISGTVLVGMTVNGTGAGSAPTVTAVDYTTGQITLSAAVSLSSSTALTFNMAAGSNIQGQRGVLSLGANGSYTYHITNNSLAAGQTATETFTYQMTDASGLRSSAVLSITIEGTTNDTEPDARADAVVAVEAGGVANGTPGVDPAGNLLTGAGTSGAVADVGSGLSLTRVWSEDATSLPTATNVQPGSTEVNGTSLVGRYGTLRIGADGSYRYTVDNTAAAVQALRGSSDTLREVFFYRVENGSGSDVASFAVTVQGANDTPAATADTTTAEASSQAAPGRDPAGNVLANDSDVDAGDSLSVLRASAGAGAPATAVTPGSSSSSGGTTLNGLYGVLVIGADGSYRYTVDSNNASVKALAAAGTLTDTFTYEAVDANGLSSVAALTVTVGGAADAPVNTLPPSHSQYDYEAAAIPGVSVADVDGDLASVTLTVRSGSLSVGSGAGQVSGNGSASLTLTGTQAEINGLLATLSYQASNSFSGEDRLTLVSTDASGQADSDSMSITVSPDPRPLSVSSPTVNEASPYLVFTVSGAAGQRALLTLGASGTGSGHATLGTDTAPALEFHDGSDWVGYNGGYVVLPGSGELLVRVAVLQDAADEGAETLQLSARNAAGVSAAGLGTLTDQGSGDVLLPDGSNDSAAVRDDDRPLTVGGATVNEASGHVIFKVSGAAGQSVDLGLRNGTAGNADHGQALEVYDPAANGGQGAWVAYGAGLVLPGSGELLVRTTITADTAYEGAETFGLVARTTGGGEAVGIAAIVDDGSGDVFLPGNITGTPNTAVDPGYPELDDDRPLSVSSPTVNEGSPHAVFTVTGNAGQRIELTLTAGSATGGGIDFGNGGLEVSVDGGLNWLLYTTAVAVPAQGQILVRTSITNDAVADNGETFTLAARPVGGLAASGTATIKDDGTGDVYGPNGTVDPSAAKDDDRPVAVSSPTVNEGSPYAVFTVSGVAGQSVSLVLGAGTAAGAGVDFGSSALEVSLDGGTTWTAYTSAVTLPNGGALLARTSITNDGIADNNETFTLTATPAGGTASVGTATIKDDGTGDIFGPNGTVDLSASKDDDRAITVSSPTVNEGSPHAVFTVTGIAGQSLSLALGAGTAAGAGVDFGGSALEVSLDGGTSWTAYTAAVTLPAGGVLLARTSITNDNIADNNETFTLTATPAGGVASVGTATIKDDGTGVIYGPNGTVDPSASKDDDRALTVSSPTVNEGSPHAVFTVTGIAGQSLSLSLGAGSATGTGVDFGGSALEVSLDGGTTWTAYTAAVTLPAGGALLARTSITNDNIADNNETFTLTATPAGGAASVGTATIKDDGTGDVYGPNGTVDPSASKDDDRALTVSSPTVNEGSPHAVFTVTGIAGQSFSLTLGASSATGTGVDFGGSALEVSLDGGTTWTAYTAAVTLPAGGVLLARTSITNDNIADNNETFTLTATPAGGTASVGTATIKDDGTGDIFGPNGTVDLSASKDDDRAITVSSPTVNEGSPHAVFTVTGIAGQSLSLALGAGTAAGAGVDFGGSALEVSLDGGTSWTAYTAAVTLPAGGVLLARTSITNDNIADNNETFTLTATPAGGVASVGTATIKDDGTGVIYGPNGTVDPSASKDDDRALTVSSPTVNEGSPHAVFTVTGIAGQSLSLSLGAGSATGTGVDFGGSALEVSLDGGTTWTAYTAAVTLPAGGALLARTSITNDNIADNNETFTLTATPAGGAASVGTATIKDDGTGDVYGPNGTVDPSASKDDDRALTVSSPTVNEGSPHAVFTVTGIAGQSLSLTLGASSATGTGVDFGGSALEVSLDGGTTWTAYTAAVTLPAGGVLLARTSITNDNIADNNETFTLTATPAGGAASVGTATIKDDGTGDIYGPNGTVDPSASKDDDRAVAVSSPTVNEGSPHAVFTVTGVAGQSVSLTLGAGSATGTGVDFGGSALEVSLDGGTTWTAYTSAVTLPAGGVLLARTSITNDGIADNNETFTLTATPAGGAASVGTATIKDDGTGDVYGPNGTVDPSASKDDDRAITVSSPTVNESSPHAVFTVTGIAGQSLSLSLGAGSATGTGVDFGGSALEVSLDGGTTWTAYTAAVTLPAGGVLMARTSITNDGIADNNETFTLTATPAGGAASVGTATIKDDGTGDVYGPNGTVDPSASKDDDRAITVSSPTVNESSPHAVFTVTGIAGQSLSLSLGAGSATGTGVDFGGSALEVSLDGGTTWTAYTAAVTLPAGGVLLARTSITNDSIADNNETFTLTATPAGGAASVGTATIMDDGTGDVYGPNGTVDPSAPKDDDRALTVSSPTVNEGSPHAVFTVTGIAGQSLSLSLGAGSATGTGVDFGGSALEVSLDGGTTWTAYTAAVTLPAGGVLLARTSITNDSIADNNETFTLTATPAGGAASAGTATLKDDGTGTIYRPDGTVDAAALRDDDRPLAVTNPTVNEASPYVLFTITGAADQRVQLATLAGSADGNDYGGLDPALPRLEVYVGDAWVAYLPGSWVTLQDNGRLLVRTAVTNDSLDEGAHSFALSAQATGGAVASGAATIDDHGSGDVYLAQNTSGEANLPGDAGFPALDDDRPSPAPVPVPAPLPVPETAPVPAAGPLPAAPVEVALPAAFAPPQAFELPQALLPSALPSNLLSVDAAYAATVAARTFDADHSDVGDIYTRSSGFRAMVTPAAQPSLQVFRGVEDQLVPAAPVLRLQVPADAFVHTDANESLQLVATLADGRPLPRWLRFDGKAGVFIGEPPAGEELDLRLKVTARDTQGREATVLFRVKSAERGGSLGRPALTSQLLRGEALAQTGQGREWHSVRQPLRLRG
ncbi:VCBS domain-containing protein [Eleftheria terrae]|uniref:VCBS domain-containing protein n=1 Tax=Eleftheria terrae TaxID=1597781 RepID=UPI00263A7DA6|nr:VCBS domain-containing protein [Eleftheria terrae]WKB55779.1 VCBS domain-containing protein [Eleftheria terrae]